MLIGFLHSPKLVNPSSAGQIRSPAYCGAPSIAESDDPPDDEDEGEAEPACGSGSVAPPQPPKTAATSAAIVTKQARFMTARESIPCAGSWSSGVRACSLL